MSGPAAMTVEQKVDAFWAKVDRSGGEDACWPWLGADNGQGYGRFAVRRGKLIYAHRFAYELLVGPIPDGLHLDHLCRNPRCVNPRHVEPVTNAENRRRGRLGQITHCPRGHPYDDANTYSHPGQHDRVCRACHRERERVLRPARTL